MGGTEKHGETSGRGSRHQAADTAVFDAGSGDGDHHGPGAAGSAVEGNRSDGSARLPR